MKKFFNLKVPVFENKRTGQLMVPLPRKKLKGFLKRKEGIVPKEIKISLWEDLK